MAPAELLNATCVANITANYTLFNTSMGNLTTCATPADPVNQAWFHLTFTRVALMSMLFAFKLSSILMVIMTSRMIYNLWSTPSYELHQELEKWYSGGLRKSEKKKYEKNHEGRYKSVTHTDDTFTGTRTITIVEDLTRVPPEKKKKKEKKQKRGEENIPLRPLRQDDGENAPPWTPAGQAWARSQTRDPPFIGARSSWFPAAGLATSPATASSSNLMATEGTQEDMTVPPPAYNGEGHIWQEIQEYAIPPPYQDYLAWWKVLLIVIGTLLGAALLCANLQNHSQYVLLKELWRTLTEKLAAEIYKRLLAQLDPKTNVARDLSKFKEKFKSSNFEIDEGYNTKIITVVKDRSKLPLARYQCFHLPAECPLSDVPAPEPAPASGKTPVTVTTTTSTTARTEVRREPAPVARSGSGGMAASGSSEVGTGPASSWGNDHDDALPVYPY